MTGSRPASGASSGHLRSTGGALEYSRARAVRRIVQGELATIADLVTVPPAGGAFYFLLRVHADIDSMHLTERLIREHKVAVIPGTTFGITEGCTLRIAYGALRQDTAVEGIRRLTHGLRSLLAD